MLLLTSCAAPTTNADDPADVELQVQLALDRAWTASPGSNARPVSVQVRFALPDGWGWWMQRCMVASGFDRFEVTLAGGFTNEGRPVEHTGAVGLAWYLCSQEYPQYYTVFARMSSEELDALYDYYEKWLVPCLAAHGGGFIELPSRAEFADGGEGQPGSWNPYLESNRPSSVADVAAQVAACPPYLPDPAEQ